MTQNQQIALFFGGWWASALCTWLWIRWRMKRDAREEAARIRYEADRVQYLPQQTARPTPPLPNPDPADWRQMAVAWLRRKATAQAENNERWPDHAACYPSWRNYVDRAQRFADELEADQMAMPYGLEA